MRSQIQRFTACLTTLAWMLSIGGASRAQAGECVKPLEYYVCELEDIAQLGPPFHYCETFMCLRMRSWPADGKRWAGPIAADQFSRCRNNPLRERIAAACLPILADTSLADTSWSPEGSWAREAAAEIAASCGYSRIGEHDIFSIVCSIISDTPGPRSSLLALLAIMLDPRTVGFLSSYYDTITSNAFDQDVRIEETLNCLYHVPGDSAIALAERIERDADSPDLKERARRVIARQAPN